MVSTVPQPINHRVKYHQGTMIARVRHCNSTCEQLIEVRRNVRAVHAIQLREQLCQVAVIRRPLPWRIAHHVKRASASFRRGQDLNEHGRNILAGDHALVGPAACHELVVDADGKRPLATWRRLRFRACVRQQAARVHNRISQPASDQRHLRFPLPQDDVLHAHIQEMLWICPSHGGKQHHMFDACLLCGVDLQQTPFVIDLLRGGTLFKPEGRFCIPAKHLPKDRPWKRAKFDFGRCARANHQRVGASEGSRHLPHRRVLLSNGEGLSGCRLETPAVRDKQADKLDMHAAFRLMV
mmetsp:Transcript_18683/g.40262  ORF Transcript_18683/g.40262 Transcript_18683/m.40262 type:complete len:296 (-) Transcript_18683:300-1187(-)